MATSSIFAKVRIDNPEQVEAFIDALIESEKKPRRKSALPLKSPLTDHELIRKLLVKEDMSN